MGKLLGLTVITLYHYLTVTEYWCKELSFRNLKPKYQYRLVELLVIVIQIKLYINNISNAFIQRVLCVEVQCKTWSFWKYKIGAGGGYRGLSVHVLVSVAEWVVAYSHRCLLSWLALQHIQNLHSKLFSPHAVDLVSRSYLCLIDLSHNLPNPDFFTFLNTFWVNKDWAG